MSSFNFVVNGTSIEYAQTTDESPSGFFNFLNKILEAFLDFLETPLGNIAKGFVGAAIVYWCYNYFRNRFHTCSNLMEDSYRASRTTSGPSRVVGSSDTIPPGLYSSVLPLDSSTCAVREPSSLSVGPISAPGELETRRYDTPEASTEDERTSCNLCESARSTTSKGDELTSYHPCESVCPAKSTDDELSSYHLCESASHYAEESGTQMRTHRPNSAIMSVDLRMRPILEGSDRSDDSVSAAPTLDSDPAVMSE